MAGRCQTVEKQLETIIRRRTSLIAQLVKNPPAMQETPVQFLDWEIPWRRERLPSPVFWPGKFHGWKQMITSLVESNNYLFIQGSGNQILAHWAKLKEAGSVSLPFLASRGTYIPQLWALFSIFKAAQSNFQSLTLTLLLPSFTQGSCCSHIGTTQIIRNNLSTARPIDQQP